MDTTFTVEVLCTRLKPSVKTSLNVDEIQNTAICVDFSPDLRRRARAASPFGQHPSKHDMHPFRQTGRPPGARKGVDNRLLIRLRHRCRHGEGSTWFFFC